MRSKSVAKHVNELQQENQKLMHVIEELQREKECLNREMAEKTAALNRISERAEQRNKELREFRELEAYTQGRIDVLDTVVHNIGNTIYGVTAELDAVGDELKNNKPYQYFCDLVRAIEVHQDDFADYVKNDPQGQKVVPLLIALASSFQKHQAQLAQGIDHAREGAHHIAAILRSERAFGRRDVYRKSVNLRKAIEQDAIRVLKNSLQRRHIGVHIDCEQAPQEIITLESQFHQMLVNLIKNAIEAIDERIASNPDWNETPTITIQCETESDFLLLSITDNGIGIGIGIDHLSAIFNPRYTTKIEGMGLGLHSAANFVRSSGGTIRAESRGIGTGATIRITLPIEQTGNEQCKRSGI
jgi:signal transduction histidine kinase